MDDATFLRNLARRGRVVILADGTALPAPTSVMDDESKAGGTFIIPLVSPEGIESGDRRTFDPGTIEHRDLPLPLMWQWQLDDGHKGAVVVGRIDYIERTERGLGNARGVFDTGPWGTECERMVRAGMLRGVSGDYSNFSAEVDKASGADEAADITDGEKPSGTEVLEDDEVNVKQSKLVAATVVSKPAFEGCEILMTDGDQETVEPDESDVDIDPDEYDYDDGVIEAAASITASALIAAGMGTVVERLERLEYLEMEIQQEELALTASALRERIGVHRLVREREDAVARIRAARNLTAAAPQVSHDFLSQKATLQPRDQNGRWIEMGAMVRWRGDGQTAYKHGRVKSFDAKTGLYTISMDDNSPNIQLRGSDLQVVKAQIPDSPESASQYLNIGGDSAATEDATRRNSQS